MTDRPTIVVEIRGPQRSGVTTLMELLALHVQDMEVPVSCPSGKFDRIRYDLQTHLRSTCCRVEVREAEPDDRDTELQSLRQERDRLRQDVERLSRRQVPPSWASGDTEWSGISGDGVLDVRGSKADIDVVASWRRAKDRLAWFEERYKEARSREAILTKRVEDLNDRLTERMTAQERSAADLGAERAAHWLTKESVDRLCEAVEALQARCSRLLVAFHDATRRPLGVTPDSGLEFYDEKMADEAEARRTRYGRGK